MDSIRGRVIIETQAEDLLACLKAGMVSTNVHFAEAPQLLSGDELAAEAGHFQMALAGNSFPAKTRYHT